MRRSQKWWGYWGYDSKFIDHSLEARWPRVGIVSDNPNPGRTRRLQGSHHATPRTTRIGSFPPLRPRSPCGSRCRPSILPYGIHSATFGSALRRRLRLPSLHLAVLLGVRAAWRKVRARRAGCQVTPGGRELTDSATESKPPKRR